ncbi:MAG: leucine-rich repeat domain-containing protein, partial [Bacteroidaceae bacterium]|nr:leucine-rich repeat domain-containing protein [Bacteroidaceae bacterium]
FYNCSSLSSVVIPSSVTSIGSDAFRGCSSLSSVTIKEGVTSIGDYAFYNCSSLSSVVIPSSVTSIGSSAFQYCSSLVLELCSSRPNSLSGISDVEHIVVPEEYYSDYRNGITSSTSHLYPASKLTFKETPTLKAFKAALASVNKDELTSITFACYNVDDYLDVATIKSGLNPNCIIYVPKGAGITGDNVVEIEPAKGLSCDKLVLTDGYPFRAPEMNVGEVQYVHAPSVWANGKSGWEAICLPFSPSSVKASTSGYLSPIVLGGSGNFWLRKYVGSSSTSVFFTSTSDGVIEANTPYLMAFPGNAFGNNSLEGQKIVFSASDVKISALADPDLIKKNAFLFKSTYNTTPDASAGYELNVEGSSFVQVPQVGTHPFRAYFVNEDEAASSVKALKIDFGSFDEETGIFEVEEATDMRMNDDACYDLSGRRVSKNSTHKGIYIVNGKKVVR